MKSQYWSVVFCLLGVLFLLTPPTFAEASSQDNDILELKNHHYLLNTTEISNVNSLKELFVEEVDEAKLDLEGLIEPAIGSTEETLQLLMAFGIIERENYWLGCKLEK